MGLRRRAPKGARPVRRYKSDVEEQERNGSPMFYATESAAWQAARVLNHNMRGVEWLEGSYIARAHKSGRCWIVKYIRH